MILRLIQIIQTFNKDTKLRFYFIFSVIMAKSKRLFLPRAKMYFCITLLLQFCYPRSSLT